MASDPTPLKILVVRPDRVGDVVLSTPVFEALKEHFPRSHLTVMVREGILPIIRGLPSVDATMVFDPDGRHAGIGGLFRLIEDIRKGGFRVVVNLQSHRKIAAATFAAGVRHRVGPVSKLHSLLFYNRGVRQRRSQVEMHETDYNLQLLRRLGVRVGTREIPTRVSIPEEAKAQSRQWLIDRGWDPSKLLIAVHPGMGGSALNWPEAHYVELIRALVREDRPVLVTAGPTEGALLDRIRSSLGADADRVIFYGGPGIGPIDHLGGILSCAHLVIAPSTGPLHLATALGKRIITFYPPIRVQSAIRWGPYLTDESRATVFVPEVYCGEDFRCRGSLCNYYPCMKSMTVTQALDEARKHLRETP